MSLMVKIFDVVDISPSEVVEICRLISDRYHRDRNAVCLLLNFCYRFIEDWYNEIIEKFTPQMEGVASGAERRFGKGDLGPLMQFIPSARYQPSCKRLERLLFENIVNRYGELHFAENLEIDKVKEIQTS
jgi:hypothetical protein